MKNAAEIVYETANGPYGFEISGGSFDPVTVSDAMLWEIADLAAAGVPHTVTATHVTRANVVTVERPEES
jgi:hypothetical protein